jgi:FdhE protein
MSNVGDLNPDPSIIGTIAKPPFVQLPDPARVLGKRAARLLALAPGHQLEGYLRFLADLSDAQLRILPELPEPDMPSADVVARAKEHAMPPLDRNAFKPNAAFDATLERLLSRAATLEMPAQAREAWDRLRTADAQARDVMIRNVLADSIPLENLAEHVFAAAALQVHFARLAQRLDKDALVSVGDGACPCCGAPPVASVVVGWPSAVGSRFCSCSLCGTLWNYVRARCAVCGSTDKISFQQVDGSDGNIKAENCDVCHSYVKVLYQQTDPALDPVADDVASLGLDLLVREAGYRRGAINAFLIGY